MTALIIDDDPSARQLLARVLETAGYFVVQAECGRKAFEILNSRPVGVALLDIEMEKMSGIEVLKQIRKTYSQNDLPVIMTTVKDENKDVLHALDCGANDYLAKPIDVPVLLARIQTWTSNGGLPNSPSFRVHEN